MPIKAKIKTIPFTDEEGNRTDADFTIRTSLSQRGRNEYMKAVTVGVPDLSAMVNADGSRNEEFKPKIEIEVIENMEKVLLADALIDLRGVLDSTGKEIKAWEEFYGFDSFYVSQVVAVLQEIAASQVEKTTPSPNASAPSVER